MFLQSSFCIYNRWQWWRLLAWSQSNHRRSPWILGRYWITWNSILSCCNVQTILLPWCGRQRRCQGWMMFLGITIAGYQSLNFLRTSQIILDQPLPPTLRWHKKEDDLWYQWFLTFNKSVSLNWWRNETMIDIIEFLWWYKSFWTLQI